MVATELWEAGEGKHGVCGLESKGLAKSPAQKLLQAAGESTTINQHVLADIIHCQYQLVSPYRLLHLIATIH